MPLYELVYLLSTKVDRARQAKVMASIASDVLTRGGVVRTLANEGICTMQAPMRRFGVKYEKGRYVHMVFDASPESLQELEDTITRKRPEVFRWLVTRKALGRYQRTLQNPLLEDRCMDVATDLHLIDLKQRMKAEREAAAAA
eukprot:EG_transcript_42153